jgi:hypothetical protein
MAQRDKTVSVYDAYSLILKGIEDAKGSPRALNYLIEDDFFNIGIRLANRESVYNRELFSIVVRPVASLKEIIKNGKHDTHSDLDFSVINFNPEVSGEKKVYFVPVNEVVPEGTEEEYLKNFGKQPLKNAVEYFFGIIVAIKLSDLPGDLSSKEIVAVSLEEQGIFLSQDGNKCFLSVSEDSGVCRLHLVEILVASGPKHRRVFLAEDI